MRTLPVDDHTSVIDGRARLKGDGKPEKRLPSITGGARNQRSRGLLLERRARFLPAGNAGGEVFDVGVAKFRGGLGSRGIRVTRGAGAIGDDERAFVRWQFAGQLGFVGLEVDGARDVAGFVGIRAIGIEQNNLLRGHRRLEIGDGDVREFSRINTGGEDE